MRRESSRCSSGRSFPPRHTSRGLGMSESTTMDCGSAQAACGYATRTMPTNAMTHNRMAPINDFTDALMRSSTCRGGFAISFGIRWRNAAAFNRLPPQVDGLISDLLHRLVREIVEGRTWWISRRFCHMSNALPSAVLNISNNAGQIPHRVVLEVLAADGRCQLQRTCTKPAR